MAMRISKEVVEKHLALVYETLAIQSGRGRLRWDPVTRYWRFYPAGRDEWAMGFGTLDGAMDVVYGFKRFVVVES